MKSTKSVFGISLSLAAFVFAIAPVVLSPSDALAKDSAVNKNGELAAPKSCTSLTAAGSKTPTVDQSASKDTKVNSVGAINNG